MEGRDQHAMIATRHVATDGSRGIAADSVGDQPFPLFGDVERAADLAAEFDGSVRLRSGRFLFGRRVRPFLRCRHLQTDSILVLYSNSAFRLLPNSLIAYQRQFNNVSGAQDT